MKVVLKVWHKKVDETDGDYVELEFEMFQRSKVVLILDGKQYHFDAKELITIGYMAQNSK